MKIRQKNLTITNYQTIYTKGNYKYCFHKNPFNIYIMYIHKNNQYYKAIIEENRQYKKGDYKNYCGYFGKYKLYTPTSNEKEIYEFLKEKYILNIEIVEKMIS